VGYLNTDCLIPMAGNDPYSSSGGCRGAALSSAEQMLAVLQVKVPIIQIKSKKFRQMLVSWIKSSGFSRTVVLSSSHTYQRDDHPCFCLPQTPLRYLATPSLLKVSADSLKTLGWRDMELVPAFPGVKDANAEPRQCIPRGSPKGFTPTESRSKNVLVLTVSSHSPSLPRWKFPALGHDTPCLLATPTIIPYFKS
uniref:Proteasome assembly chaperone 2 n=1 Tax=Nothobranchius furzeri TaxID=105023 RepID=A0A8C6PXV0_NOTFU